MQVSHKRVSYEKKCVYPHSSLNFENISGQSRGPGVTSASFVRGCAAAYAIGKLTHPQTKADLSISKNTPIARLCTIKHEPKLTKLQQVLFNVTKTTHSQVLGIIEMVTSLAVSCIRIMTHPRVFGQKFTPIRMFLVLEKSPPF